MTVYVFALYARAQDKKRSVIETVIGTISATRELKAQFRQRERNKSTKDGLSDPFRTPAQMRKDGARVSCMGTATRLAQDR